MERQFSSFQPLAAPDTVEFESSRNKEFAGICSICVKAPVCLLHKASNQPVIECGTFESSQGSFLSARASTAESGSTRSRDPFRGLCSDCELRHDCRAVKPESGIWHCKHYR